MTRPVDQHLTWCGDPTILVYAVRYALGRQGSHAPVLVANTVTANARQLSVGARTAIVRDLTAWLDTVGADSPPADKDPWIAALRALGVGRPIETLAELAAVLPPIRARRAS